MTPTFKQAKQELAALGYTLLSVPRRSTVTYTTRPKGAGTTNYFRNLDEVAEYIKRVKEIRSWQTDTP